MGVKTIKRIAKKRGSSAANSSKRLSVSSKTKAILNRLRIKSQKTQKSPKRAAKKPNVGLVQWFPDALYSHQLNLIRLNQQRLSKHELCLKRLIHILNREEPGRLWMEQMLKDLETVSPPSPTA